LIRMCISMRHEGRGQPPLQLQRGGQPGCEPSVRRDGAQPERHAAHSIRRTRLSNRAPWPSRGSFFYETDAVGYVVSLL